MFSHECIKVRAKKHKIESLTTDTEAKGMLNIRAPYMTKAFRAEIIKDSPVCWDVRFHFDKTD